MKTKYENSIIYQINSSAKHFDKLFEQFFKEINIGVTAAEHLALMIVHDTKDCCQRDLARVLLKDRANTGKLAKSLEEKGFDNGYTTILAANATSLSQSRVRSTCGYRPAFVMTLN